MRWIRKIPEACHELERAIVAILVVVLVLIGAVAITRGALREHGLWPLASHTEMTSAAK